MAYITNTNTVAKIEYIDLTIREATLAQNVNYSTIAYTVATMAHIANTNTVATMAHIDNTNKVATVAHIAFTNTVSTVEHIDNTNTVATVANIGNTNTVAMPTAGTHEYLVLA